MCLAGAALPWIPSADATAAGVTLWREPGDRPVVRDPKFDPHRSLAPLIDAVGPAVVSVRVLAPPHLRHAIPPGRDGQMGVGSGFVLSPDGLVLTNHHVVARSDRFEVELADGRSYPARVLGSDPATDIAVLRVEGAPRLPSVVLGTSASLRVGDWVVAIGTPAGLGQSASTGIVAAKGRGSLGLYADSYIDFIQLDAALAPGNSGGPLFNLRGEVVGVNTAVAALPGRGPGFAIPIDQIKRILPQLVRDGRVARGWLGVATSTARHASSATPPERGAVVAQVYPHTPAARAGLRAGDRIVRIDGEPVADGGDLRARIATHGPKERVRLDVRRGGKPVRVTVTLGERPDLGRTRPH